MWLRRLAVIAVVAASFSALQVDAATPRPAKRYWMSNKAAVCNDGSPQGYYVRPSPSGQTDNWLIFSQGGGFCFNDLTCKHRGHDYTSSTNWKPEMTASSKYGILADDPAVSGEFHDFNFVYVPYCTSDEFVGHRPAKETDVRFDFYGSLTYPSLVDDLVNRPPEGVPSLSLAKNILFTGSSAGGVGAWMGAATVAKAVPHADLRVLPDGGWFYNIPLYEEKHPFPIELIMRMATVVWEPVFPEQCVKDHPDYYYCMAGPYIWKYMPVGSGKVFIMKSYTDAFDIGWNQIDAHPERKGGHWNEHETKFLSKLVAATNATFDGVTDIRWNINCAVHTAIWNDSYNLNKIDGISLRQAVERWFFHGDTRNYIDTCRAPNCNPTCDDEHLTLPPPHWSAEGQREYVKRRGNVLGYLFDH